MCSRRGVAFACLTEDDGIVHRSRLLPVAVQDENGPLYGRPLGSVIEGGGAVPLDGLSAESAAAYQRACTRLIRSKHHLSCLVTPTLPTLQDESVSVAPYAADADLRLQCFAAEPDSQLSRQHL